MSRGQYLQDAMINIQRGTPFRTYHYGEERICYVTRIGPDQFKMTSTNPDRTTIFTHMFDKTITRQYLSNKGITFPKGF